MMIRPVAFHRNEQTAVNNHYQQAESGDLGTIQSKALAQFDQFVTVLRREGVKVTVIEDTKDPSTPDSIFPNNWISFHQGGKLRLFPMYAENRRAERRDDIIALLKSNFEIDEVIDYTHWEYKTQFLEGTGSMILDRQNKIAYAALSDRTMPDVLSSFCEESGYKSVSFRANQTVEGHRLPIYHTNVMMCLGEGFAIVCLSSIDATNERAQLISSLKESEKEIIDITEAQVEDFAGNMLQVCGSDSQRLIVMSESAFQCLTHDQINQLSKHGKLVYSDIHTIEKLGGGSARCMMAEIFLQEKKN